MPLSAIIDRKKVIATLYTDQEWSDLKKSLKLKRITATLVCCGGECFARTSHLGTKHFYHKSKGDCSSGGESPEHLYLKSKIVEYCKMAGARNIQVEKTSGKWIADVYCELGDRKIVFEVQLSSQTLEDTIHRTQRYHNEGIECHWLFKKIPKRYYGYLAKQEIYQKFYTKDKIEYEKKRELFIISSYTLNLTSEMLTFPYIVKNDKEKFSLKSVRFPKEFGIKEYVRNILIFERNFRYVIKREEHYSLIEDPLLIQSIDLWIERNNEDKQRKEKEKQIEEFNERNKRELQNTFELYLVFNLTSKIKNEKKQLKSLLIIKKRDNSASIKIVEGKKLIEENNDYIFSDIADMILFSPQKEISDYLINEFVRMVKGMQILEYSLKKCYAKVEIGGEVENKEIPIEEINYYIQFIKKNKYLY